MDPSKIERELGWKPSVTFPEGIAKTFDWYKSNDAWMKALQTSR
jgi:dTDP-glucose 4,6-dehydratase